MSQPAPDASSRSVRDGLAAFAERFQPASGPAGEADAPVLLLSAAWRSGSTLLQRLVSSTGEVLVWGEPYERGACIRRMAEMFRGFDESWPPENYVNARPTPGEFTDTWTANLYPPPESLLDAHRRFFDTLFAEPARRLGFSRWGLKTVRLGGEHALYLKALYPAAPVVFLVRNPYDAWLSYRVLHDRRPTSRWWHYRWPDMAVSTAAEFGLVWRSLVTSFREVAHDVGALTITYGALGRGDVVDDLCSHIGIDVEPSVLESVIGSSRDVGGRSSRLPAYLPAEELWQLREAVDPVARDLGFTRPSEDGW